MAFQGETSQITLASIFQTLSLGGQDGVLSIQAGERQRRVRFQGTVARLLPDCPGSEEPLRHVLVKEKILTKGQFSNILQTLPSGRRRGDALLQRGILSDDHLRGPVRFHFKELLLETLSWQGARFDFVAGTPQDEEEFFDPEAFAPVLSFEVTALLMEAARREDEWQRIRQLLPDQRTVLVPLNEEDLRRALAELELPQGLGEELQLLLTGEHDLRHVAEASRFPGFHLFAAVTELLDRGVLRPLSYEESKELALHMRRQLRLEEAADLFQFLTEQRSDDREVREILVGVLEQLDRRSELLEQRRRLAELALSGGELQSAEQYLKNIVELDPENLEALRDLHTLYRDKGEHDKAFHVAHVLVQTARSHHDAAYARPFLEACVRQYPEELSFRHALAAVCSKAGDQQAALEILTYLADQYRKTGAVRNLRRTYEQIVKIDPRASRTLDRISDWERKNRYERAGRIPRMIGRALIAGLLLGVLLFAVREIGAYRRFARAEQEVGTLLGKERFEDAAKVIQDIASSYRYSTVQFFLRTLAGRVRKAQEAARLRLAEMRRKRRLENESRLTSAKIAFRNGRWQEANSLLSEITVEDLQEPEASEALQLQAQIRTHFEAAASLAQRAEQAEKEGKLREAFLAWRQLLNEYPEAEVSRRARLPLQIHTLPEGAQVSVDGVPHGTTPCVVSWSPRAPALLKIKKKSYRPVTYLLADVDQVGWSFAVTLQRLATWERSTGAVLTARASPCGSRIVLADRNGRVTALDRATGSVVWTKSIGELGGVNADLRRWRDKVVCLTVEGTLYVFGPKGQMLDRTPFPALAPARISPSAVTEAGTVVLAGEEGLIVAYSLPKKRVVWQFNLPGKTRLTPTLWGEIVLAADREGNVFFLEAETGSVRDRKKLADQLLVSPLALNTLSWVGATEKELLLAEGKEVYRTPLSASPTTELVSVGGRIGLATRDNFFAAYASKKLSFLWKVKLPDRCSDAVATTRYVYCACGSTVVAVRADGTLIWRFDAGSALTSLSLLPSGALLAGTSNSKLYLFDLRDEQ